MTPARKAQTRLQFTPLLTSSPAKEEYSHSVQDRLANVRLNRAERKSREVASIPTPEPSSQLQSHPHKGRDTVGQDEEDDEILLPAAKRPKTYSQRPRQTTLTPRRSSRLQDRTSLHTRPSSSASSSSTQRLDSVDIPTPTPARRTRSVHLDHAHVRSSPPPRITTGLSDLGSPETSGDDDGAIATKPVVQRQRRKRSPLVRDDFIVPDHENIASSSDDDDAPITPARKRKSHAVLQTPRTRRLKSRREHQELKDDLDDLHDSDSAELLSSRTRGAPVNKERERRREYIEMLKRRRAGEKEPINLDPDNEGELEEIDYISSYTPYTSAPFFGRRKDAYHDRSSSEDDMPQNPNLDVDEDDFVVADEEVPPGGLGQPHPDIPLEFTSYASAKPRELFIHVIEWLIKNKISPAFSRHDPLWKLAFTKIEDEVTAQAGSRLKSSAWNGPFNKALNARPGLTTTAILPGENSLHSCDACNKSNHPAKYDFVFSGSAYHHDSLEPVDPDSSEEPEAAAPHDTSSLDSRGHPLPNLSTHFFLGRYCAANAELAHRFTHWKHNLNEEVIRYLESQGVLSAEEIVRRERSKGGQRKREKEAEEIVDQMKDSGVIEELWRGFKDDLEDARIGMEGHERKGNRGSRRIGSVRVPVSDVVKVDDDGVAQAAEIDFGAHVQLAKPRLKTKTKSKEKMTISISDDEQD